MYGGELKTRTFVEIRRATVNGTDTFSEKITAIQLFKGGGVVDAPSAHTGDIVKVFGLRNAAINDWIGERKNDATSFFARPSLEVVITPENQTDRPKLHKALTRISEQDPLTQIHQSDRGTLSIRLYGEVQREIIQTLLRDEYGISVLFEKTQTIYIERVKGIGTAFADKMDKDNFFEATIGLKIARGDPESGVVFKIGVGRGSLPVAFQTATEDTVYTTLQQGLYGWEVTDCVIEVTDAGYWDATSTGGDFRGLTPLLLMEALKKAGTEVYEPRIHYLNRYRVSPKRKQNLPMLLLPGMELVVLRARYLCGGLLTLNAVFLTSRKVRVCSLSSSEDIKKYTATLQYESVLTLTP
jgi:ribosomal protection tetracycline resistance protein